IPAALALTVTVSTVLLWIYRGALEAAMRAKADRSSSGSVLPTATRSQPLTRVPVRHISVVQALASGRNSTVCAIASARWKRAALAYLLAGLVQATVGASLILLLSNRAFLPLRFATLVWIYAWPVILTWNLLSGPDRKLLVRWASGYFAGLAA